MASGCTRRPDQRTRAFPEARPGRRDFLPPHDLEGT